MFVNRDQEAQKTADKRMRQKVSLLAAALGNPGPVQQAAGSPRKGETERRPPLCRDQCTYRRETGHWGHECPQRRRTPEGHRSPVSPVKESTSLSQASKTLSARLEQSQTRGDQAP